MILKRILTGSFIIMICVMMFLTGYTKVTSSYCYADTNTDSWTQVTTNQQLVEAFRYYCKSRDLTIDGSVADGLTKFTTNAFNGICNTLGINVTALQAQIKYQTDGNIGTRFLFSALGIDAYNRIFAQFLQDNNLQVGQSYNNKNIYSNQLFKDAEGNSCFVYVIPKRGWCSASDVSNNYLAGTKYIYNGEELFNYGLSTISGSAGTFNKTFYLTSNLNTTQTFYFNNHYQFSNTNYRIGVSMDDNNILDYSLYAQIYEDANYTNLLYSRGGELIISRLYNSDELYFGVLTTQNDSNHPNNKYYFYQKVKITNSNISNVNITVNTNNLIINNNNYEGDTVINNNGDTIVNEPIPDDPDVPEYNPYPDGDPNPTPPTDVGGGDQSDDTNITFPDFEFNFPEIDWSIGDLSQKFPFSIPFDLIAFFTVLNAEPEAPRIDANIPLGNWYTWHFEADFSQFDRYASIVRHVEFISFVVALIYLTIRLVKG